MAEQLGEFAAEYISKHLSIDERRTSRQEQLDFYLDQKGRVLLAGVFETTSEDKRQVLEYIDNRIRELCGDAALW